MSNLRQGVTLIELMVVLVIVGLAVGMLLPRLGGGLLGATRLRAAAQRLAAVVGYVRDKAVTSRCSLNLEVDFTRNSWQVLTGDPAASVTYELPHSTFVGGMRLRQLCFTESRRVVNSGRAFIRFTAEDWVDPAVIELADADGETMSVVIADPTGRVQIYRGQVELGEDGQIRTLQ